MANYPLEEYKFKEKLDLGDLKSVSEIQKIVCPSCSKMVSAEHLNIQTNIAKCISCDGIFSFEKTAEKIALSHGISPEVLRPEGVELTRFQDELDISVEQPWGNLEIVLFSFFPLLVIMITSIFIERFPAPATLLAKAVVITFWVASIIGYIAYIFIRKKHKVYIHIDHEYLSTEQRPKKFIKDKKYAIRDIDQVYIKNIVSSGTTKGAGIFMIVNASKGQKHIELIKLVKSRTKAKYIEQEIERHLRIPDRRVPDEAT